ncbi:hypothetical protein [Konateibacter massiliensis]|uniref:hypothetical protein n=1 Tax=Konateibacter massiliensis TaxID=2002841 RepID=UPI001F3315A0|nr:hypothetical protein [Konateibacter massiliensis]
MGHSLGALICLYSIFRNDDYGKIASLCASQWYDKWLSFIETEHIINKDINLLLLAGRREGEGKSTIQKDTTKCTQLSCEIFQKRLGNDRVEMLWDDYGHHDNMISRYTTALEFLMKD